MKQARLQYLRSRKARLDRNIAAGRVHISRGGKRLLPSGLHLDQAGITKEPVASAMGWLKVADHSQQRRRQEPRQTDRPG